MARIAIELSAREYETLQRRAMQNKRTPKAQAEWDLVGIIREYEEKQWLLGGQGMAPPEIGYTRNGIWYSGKDPEESICLPMDATDPRNVVNPPEEIKTCMCEEKDAYSRDFSSSPPMPEVGPTESWANGVRVDVLGDEGGRPIIVGDGIGEGEKCWCGGSGPSCFHGSMVGLGDT